MAGCADKMIFLCETVTNNETQAEKPILVGKRRGDSNELD
jgi:hypothetical protein